MQISTCSLVALSICLARQVYAAGNPLERKTVTIVDPPSCSLTCLGTLIPKYCASMADKACICSSPELAAELSPCAVAACNVTDSLQLARYTAETCDVPNDMSRYWRQIHLYLVLVPLTTLFVAARIFSRIRLNFGLGPDDWILLLAFSFYLCMTSCAWVIAVTGFGQHTFWLLTRQVEKALKYFYIAEILYLCAITFTKLSLLLFFRRIFPSRGFRRATLCVGAFVAACNFSMMMALAFQCIPIHGVWINWKYAVPPVQQCINLFAAVYVAAGMSILHDIIVLCMPIPTLWGLNLSMRKKANLIVMFGVGFFVIVASIIRLPSLMKMGVSTDVSYEQAPVAVWTNLETAVGIICACLPACGSLAGFYFPYFKISLSSTSSSGRKAPGYVNTSSSNTKEYFSKKRAGRDSFLELDDQSRTDSQEELKRKKSKTAQQHVSVARKSSDDDNTHNLDDVDGGDGAGEINSHAHTKSHGLIEERFMRADPRGFGHMATVVVGNTSDGTMASPGSVKSRTPRDILMTRTLEQSTTSRL